MSKPIPIYIAASSTHTAHMRKFAQELEQHGLRVTHHWWDDVDQARGGYGSDHDLPDARARVMAERDLEGVRAAAVVVWYCYAPSTGAPFEAGFAHASGRPLVVLSNPRMIWCTLDGVIHLPLDASVEHIAGIVHRLCPRHSIDEVTS